MPQYDDYSQPIKFDIVVNDMKFTDIFAGDDFEWYCDIDEFYDHYFDMTDNLIITGSTDTYEAHGPFITDTFAGE